MKKDTLTKIMIFLIAYTATIILMLNTFWQLKIESIIISSIIIVSAEILLLASIYFILVKPFCDNLGKE